MSAIEELPALASSSRADEYYIDEKEKGAHPTLVEAQEKVDVVEHKDV
jgi:hypothetical protein